jgi:D-glycero-D-manno-heptose 1,7-bisphosphate phosphatase
MGDKTVNKAIFCDRDGVINKAIVIRNKPFSPENVNEVEINDGIDDLLRFLSTNGYYIIVVSNQPTTPKKNVEAINRYLEWCLPIDSFKICYHKTSDNCLCKKPKIGLFLEAIQEFNIDVSQSYLVGDRASDIIAGKDAGCKKTIFIDYDYAEVKPENPDYIVKSVKDIIPFFEKELGIAYQNIC